MPRARHTASSRTAADYRDPETAPDTDVPAEFDTETRKSYVDPEDTERSVYEVLDVVNGTDIQVDEDASLYCTESDESVPDGSVQLISAPADTAATCTPDGADGYVDDDTSTETGEQPTALHAATCTAYDVDGVRPLICCVVEVEIACSAPSRYTRYASTDDPPSSTGGDHDTEIPDADVPETCTDGTAAGANTPVVPLTTGTTTVKNRTEERCDTVTFAWYEPSCVEPESATSSGARPSAPTTERGETSSVSGRPESDTTASGTGAPSLSHTPMESSARPARTTAPLNDTDAGGATGWTSIVPVGGDGSTGETTVNCTWRRDVETDDDAETVNMTRPEVSEPSDENWKPLGALKESCTPCTPAPFASNTSTYPVAVSPTGTTTCGPGCNDAGEELTRSWIFEVFDPVLNGTVYTPAAVEAGTVTVNVAVPEAPVRTDDGVTDTPAGTTR